MKRLQLLTASSARTYRRCPREYHYRYQREVVPTRFAREDQLAPTFGTLFHFGLQYWWEALRGCDAEHFDRNAPGQGAWDLMRGIHKLHREKGGELGILDQFDLVRAEELMLGYHVRWIDETIAHYEVLAVEQEYCEDLVNPLTGSASRTFARAGKLDAVVRSLRTSRTYVAEHKTTSDPIEPGDTYWKRLTLDPQVSTYLASHPEHAGVIYDVIGKPKLEPLKATPLESRKYTKEKVDKKTGEVTEPSRLYADQRENDETLDEWRLRLRAHIQGDPDRYFCRGEIVRLPEEITEAAFDDWQTAKSIRESQYAKQWPRNADACVRFRRLCPYFAACSRTASIDDRLEFRHERAHRELSDALVRGVTSPEGQEGHVDLPF